MMVTAVKSAWESGRLVFRRRSDEGGIIALNPSRLTRFMSVSAIATDDDTLTGAMIAGGIITYTADNNGGTLTFDSGANLDIAFPTMQIGEVVAFFIINLGGFTATLAADGGASITLALALQLIKINEGVKLLLRKTATGEYSVYHVGGSP